MSVDVTNMGDLDIHVVRREGTPLFVVREVDSKAIRQTPGFTKGKSEQSIRSEIRASILALKLRSIQATKTEIQLLKEQEILGKRAPSAMLLDGKDMMSLLMHYKSHKYTRMWQLFLESDRKVHKHSTNIPTSAEAANRASSLANAATRSRPRKQSSEKRKRSVRKPKLSVLPVRIASESESSSSDSSPGSVGKSSPSSQHMCSAGVESSADITCPVCKTFKRNQEQLASYPLTSVFPSSSPPLQSHDRVPSLLAPMTPLTPLAPMQMVAPMLSPLPPLSSEIAGAPGSALSLSPTSRSSDGKTSSHYGTTTASFFSLSHPNSSSTLRKHRRPRSPPFNQPSAVFPSRPPKKYKAPPAQRTIASLLPIARLHDQDTPSPYHNQTSDPPSPYHSQTSDPPSPYHNQTSDPPHEPQPSTHPHNRPSSPSSNHPNSQQPTSQAHSPTQQSIFQSISSPRQAQSRGDSGEYR